MNRLRWFWVMGGFCSSLAFASSPFVAGDNFACLLHEKESTVSCWDEFGRSLSTPRFKKALQIAADNDDICVVDGGRVRCWAYFRHATSTANALEVTEPVGLAGKLNRWFSDLSHVTVFSLSEKPKATASEGEFPGDQFACAYDTVEKLRCRGTKELENSTPQGKVPKLLYVSELAFACAVWEGNTLSCWGTPLHRAVPVSLPQPLIAGFKGLKDPRELTAEAYLLNSSSNPFWLRVCVLDRDRLHCFGATTGEDTIPVGSHDLCLHQYTNYWIDDDELHRNPEGDVGYNALKLDHPRFLSGPCLINDEEVVCADGRRFYHGEKLPAIELTYLKSFLHDVAEKVYVDKRALLEAAIPPLALDDPKEALFGLFALGPVFSDLDSGFAAEVKPYYLEERQYWEKRTGLMQLTDFPRTPRNVETALELIHVALAPLRGEKACADFNELVGRALASHAALPDLARVSAASKALLARLEPFVLNPRTRTFGLVLQSLLGYF